MSKACNRLFVQTALPVDFTGICIVAFSPFCIVVRQIIQPKSHSAFIGLAKRIINVPGLWRVGLVLMRYGYQIFCYFRQSGTLAGLFQAIENPA